MEFENKVIVVTGGNNGIGKEIVKYFNNLKSKTVVIDMDHQNVDCEFYFKGDISCKNVLENFSKEIIKEFKSVDVLINNACISKRGILSKCTYEDFLYVLKVGVVASYYLSLLLKDSFSKNASIVNISSTRANMSQPDTESYTSAKGGISALTHSLAVSLAGKVRVNSISPGWIDNKQSEWEKSDYYQHLTRSIGEAKDIAEMVVFLSSSKAKFITGENINIDGGMSKQMIYHGDNNWRYREEVK